MLQQYEIIISPDSQDLGLELNSWVWLDKVAEKTLDGWCHLIDATRYICRHIIKPKGSGKGVKKISYKRK